VISGFLSLAGLALAVILLILRAHDYVKIRRKVRPVKWNDRDDEPRA
jgi:hypothetical protein